MPKKATKATPPSGHKEKRTRAPKPAGEPAPRKLRQRINKKRHGKNGQVSIRVFVPRELLPKIMDRKVLGSSFGAFARNVWENRTADSPQVEPPRPLKGRACYFPEGTDKAIREFEEAGGNLDALVWAQLKKKVA